MLIFNNGYTFLRYEPATNQVHLTELARTPHGATARTSYGLPDFLLAITPVPEAEDID